MLSSFFYVFAESSIQLVNAASYSKTLFCQWVKKKSNKVMFFAVNKQSGFADTYFPCV